MKEQSQYSIDWCEGINDGIVDGYAYLSISGETDSEIEQRINKADNNWWHNTITTYDKAYRIAFHTTVKARESHSLPLYFT